MLSKSLPAVIPPLKNEDEARDQRRRAGQGHVKLGRQRRQEHCRHGDVLGDSQRASQVVEDEGDLEKEAGSAREFLTAEGCTYQKEPKSPQVSPGPHDKVFQFIQH